MPRFFQKAREPMSSFTHFWGILLFAAGAVLLFVKAAVDRVTDPTTLLSLGAFALSLVLLYSASCIYHYSGGSERKIRVLRKLDHSMIYVLIAGTYTPILAHYLEREKSIPFIAAMWVIALSGIVMKICWIKAPRWLTSVLYILMGWAILADVSIFSNMQTGALFFLVAGGISYTVGGIMYGLKKPNFGKTFGFHEVFHLFVLGGSLFHYLLVFFYIA